MTTEDMIRELKNVVRKHDNDFVATGNTNISLMCKDSEVKHKKYEFTNKTIKIAGHTLHRIRAVRDFGDVKAGDLGGFIEKEDNLSHEGNVWTR